MKHLLTLLIAAFCSTVVGQVTYPYNPDGNADTLIGVTDLQDLLTTYGQPFLPSEILVEGQTLTTVLTDLQQSIDSLSALSGGGGGSVLDMPIGTILPVASEAVPEGWVLCDGRELAIEDYQGLYDLIGTTYGAGDSAFWAQVFYPATTFNIPDLRGRTIIGANDMGGEQSDVLTIHQASAGQVGGEELHQLTEAEMPSHSHQVEIEGWEFFYLQGGYDGFSGPQEFPTTSQEETSFEGGDQPHNNMQPYMALNYMMKVQAAEDVVAELTGQIAALESQVEELSNTPGFPFAEVQIIECGNPASCDFTECSPVEGDWNFDDDELEAIGESLFCGIPPWDVPTWLRFEIHAPWIVEVEGVQFSYAFDSNYGEGFGVAPVNVGGLGTDRITFTVYHDLSNISPWEGVPSTLQDEAMVYRRYVNDFNTVTFYHHGMSVLIGGVWYDSGIHWK